MAPTVTLLQVPVPDAVGQCNSVVLQATSVTPDTLAWATGGIANAATRPATVSIKRAFLMPSLLLPPRSATERTSAHASSNASSPRSRCHARSRTCDPCLAGPGNSHFQTAVNQVEASFSGRMGEGPLSVPLTPDISLALLRRVWTSPPRVSDPRFVAAGPIRFRDARTRPHPTAP